MKSALSKLALLAVALIPSLPAQQAGLTPQWDIRTVLEQMSAHAGRLLPMLDQIDSQSWTSKGASETFVAQLNTCKVQTKAIQDATLSLSKQPERLPLALETLLRLHAIDTTFASLQEGIRKYQNPALADLLIGVVGENGANRGKFQQYVLDLATDKDQELKIMDHEAQRCRDFLVRQPAPKTTGGK